MKVNLTKPQYQVSSSNKRFRVLISGRRFGKTYLTIIEMMKQASIPNQIIWYVAPTFKMAKEICWSDLKQMLSKYNWIEDINETTLTIRIRKTNSVIANHCRTCGKTTISIVNHCKPNESQRFQRKPL